MPRYEYKIVPAPTKGLKGKGVRGAEARFSNAVQDLMNSLSDSGWEYQRAETLPSIERSGLTGSTTEWRNVLVFRRLRENDADAFTPELLPAPAAVAPTPEILADPVAKTPEKTDQVTLVEGPKTVEPKGKSAVQQAWDNGVEDTDNVSDMSGPLSKLAEVRKSDKSIT